MKGFVQKVKDVHTVWLILIALLAPGTTSVVVFGQDIAYWVVKDSVKTDINDSVAAAKKEIDQQRHNDMVAISELLMAISEVREKAEELKKERRATSAILEAIDNGD